MKPTAFGLLLSLACLLAALLGTESLTLTSGGIGQTIAVHRSEPLPATPPYAPSNDRSEVLAAIVQARPLFSPSRRPPPGMADIGGAQPRLSAVLISQSRRLAIFADETGKPITLGEGGRIGASVVRLIAPGRVTLSGPGGTSVVQPSFAPASAAADPAQAGGGPPPASISRPPSSLALGQSAQQTLVDLVRNGPSAGRAP